jgi:trigger factor
MGTWMRQLIIGKSINETVEGISEKEESPDENQTEKFIPTLCRITIKAIWKSELPPLDDALAKKAGLKTIDELRIKVKEDLENRSNKDEQNELRAQVEKLILEKYPFPASLIEKQSKEMIADRIQKLKKHEHSTEHLTQMSKEIETNIMDELTKAYRLYFLTQKIAKNENITVYESEIYREGVSRFMHHTDRNSLLTYIQNDEVKSKLYVDILTRKVLDFIVNKSSIS